MNSKSQIVRLGFDNHQMKTALGKHSATNDKHIRSVVERLTAAGDNEAAETIIWLVWWNEFYSLRMYEAYQELYDERGQPRDATTIKTDL